MAIILTLDESDDLPLECLNKTSNQTLVGGWATPLKKYEFVNWDDDYSQYMGK